MPEQDSRRAPPISQVSRACQKISEADLNDYFWYGLPAKTRKFIFNRFITLQNPPACDNTKAPVIDEGEALKAGQYILFEGAFDVVDTTAQSPIGDPTKCGIEEEAEGEREGGS